MTSAPQSREGAVGAMPSWTFWALLVFFGVGLALRIGMATAQGLSVPPIAGSDEEEYVTYAWNLSQGNGYRGMSPDVKDQDHLTAYRSPGPSAVFAAAFLLVGKNYGVLRILNCLIGALGILAVYRVGKATFNRDIGMIAAGGYSIFPLAVLQSASLLSEPLGVLLFLMFLDAAMLFSAKPNWVLACLTGSLLGLALLTRASFVLFLPFFVVWILWQFRWEWRVLAKGACIMLVAALVLAPWTVRNYLVFKKVIPFATMGGSALLQGNNRLVVTDPRLFGYSVWDTQIPEYKESLQTAGNEVERDDRAKRFAVQWLSQNRDKWAFLLWHKSLRAWTPFLSNNPSAAHRLLYLVAWGPVLTLFCVAFVPTLLRSVKEGHAGWVLHLAIIYYWVNSVVFFANIRYRAPIDPICLVFAAWTLLHVVQGVKQWIGRSSEKSSVSVVGS